MKNVYEAPEAVQYSYVPSYLATDPMSGLINGGAGEGGNTDWDEEP